VTGRLQARGCVLRIFARMCMGEYRMVVIELHSENMALGSSSGHHAGELNQSSSAIQPPLECCTKRRKMGSTTGFVN